MRGWLYFGDESMNGRAARSRKAVSRHSPGFANPAKPQLDHLDPTLVALVAMEIEQRVADRTRDLEKMVEALQRRQLQLEVQAHHDPLTGLANRKLLEDRFQCAVERAKRSGDSFALLMIDLDGFKSVNDTHGHLAGDKVLVTVSQRLAAVLRTCDTAARLGGDEFVVILESIHDTGEVARISRKLVRALYEDIELPNHCAVNVGASIGIALYPDDGLDLSEMLAIADQAMYECKTTGHMSLPMDP